MGRFGVRLSMLAIGLSVTTLYLAAAVFLVRLLVLALGGAPNPVTTVATLAAATVFVGYLSYRVGTARTLATLDAVELPRARDPELFRRLDELCEAMDVERPRLLVASMGAPNAFTLGSGRRGVIVVDRSLFRLLDRDEFEAVIAHELAHLASYDSLFKTLAYSAVQTATGVAFLLSLPVVLVLVGLARGLAWAFGRPAGWSGHPLVRTRRLFFHAGGVLFFLLVVALFAYSRRREFAADARAARVTGKPLALARGLRRMDHERERWLLSSLTVRGPDEHSFSQLLSTHPPTEERIERLVRRSERRRRSSVAPLPE
jgi:heat shock protein HtpX